MRSLTASAFLALVVCAHAASASVILKCLDTSGSIKVSRDSELASGKAAWAAFGDGYVEAPGGGRSSSAAAMCIGTDDKHVYGLYQTVELNRSETRPLVISGWSRAEGVDGAENLDYSLYADVTYSDGSQVQGIRDTFSIGTHDWEHGEIVFAPEKPVREIKVYGIFRKHAGKVWFDDISVGELPYRRDLVTYQGTAYTLQRRPSETRRNTISTGDGLSISLGKTQVTSVRLDGTEIAGNGPSGFMVRDTAARSSVHSFDMVRQKSNELNGKCPALDLEIRSRFTSSPDHIRVDGRLMSTRKSDRAVTLAFALPIDAVGWEWWHDVRRSRTIVRPSSACLTEYANTVDINGAGSTGTQAVYPISAVSTTSGPNRGIALGLDMGKPSQHRLVYNAAARQMQVVFDFGLVSDTENFPNSADFCFVIYRVDPEWGFRSAWDRYTRMFPEYFTVRSTDQGNWVVSEDLSKIENVKDFGFRYHELLTSPAFDNENGILCFPYTEPTTWWMWMDEGFGPTVQNAVAKRAEYARANPPAEYHTDHAKASIGCNMLNANGDPHILFLEGSPTHYRCVWYINWSPYAGTDFNSTSVYWTKEYMDRYYDGKDLPYRVDGEYLDSLDAFYEYAALDYSRANFVKTTIPLTFEMDTWRPVTHRGFGNFEHVKWVANEMRKRDKLTFANYVPKKFYFLCAYLDVMGTETYWLRGAWYNKSDTYSHPETDENLIKWRTLACRKPYCLLQNENYNKFTNEMAEKYFRRCAFYGIFASFFTGDESDYYFKNPKWYNRDRDLFKKYSPIIEQVAEAGWYPLTYATSDDPDVYVERFGHGESETGVVYITLLNESTRDRTVNITLDKSALGLRGEISAAELINGINPTLRGDRISVTIAAGDTYVVKLNGDAHSPAEKMTD